MKIRDVLKSLAKTINDYHIVGWWIATCLVLWSWYFGGWFGFIVFAAMGITALIQLVFSENEE